MFRTLLTAILAVTLFCPDLLAQSVFGNALTLTGDTSYVDLGNHENHGFDGDFTLSCWFKTPSQERQRLLYRFQLGVVSGYAIFVDFGKLVAGVWAGGALLVQHPDFTGGPIYADNEWHHVAMVRQGSSLRLIADGQTVASRDGVGFPIQPDAPTTIGADIVPEDLFFFEGQIDEVRMWNRARSETDIRATMFDTLGPAYYAGEDSGLVGYWRFEQMEDLGVGTPGANDVRDLSVYARHGDFVGNGRLEPTMDDDFSRPRLTLIFQEMGAPHFGEKFEVRVIDQSDDREVARHTLDAIDRNDIEIWLNAILVGHSYTIDFYADHNGNGTYDSPPTDHAWRMTLEPAAGNDSLTFVHNISFTDIGWTPLFDTAFYEAIWKGLVANSDGSTFDFRVTYREDAENGTIDGMLEANDAFGIFDLLQIYFGGTFSPAEDSGSVSITDGPTSKSTQNDWSGLLRYTNNGRVTSNINYDAMGLTADFSLEGTAGKTQWILEYQSEMLDLDGKILIKEDSVLAKSFVAVDRNELPISSGLLEQNYPNPFKPVTNIPFEMPESGWVEIAVYDLLGRRVQTLFDGYRPAGAHIVSFRGSDLGSGIYTYRLEARLASGRKVKESKRLAIVK